MEPKLTVIIENQLCMPELHKTKLQGQSVANALYLYTTLTKTSCLLKLDVFDPDCPTSVSYSRKFWIVKILGTHYLELFQSLEEPVKYIVYAI